MQEELTSKTIAVSVRAATLTARLLQKVFRAVLQQIKEEERKDAAKARKAVEEPKGKQSLKKLMRSKETLTKVEAVKEDLKPFQKVAKKYGISFAVTKEKGTSPPRYLLFFKGKDIDVITAAFEEYTRLKVGIDEKHSIRESLDEITKETKARKAERSQVHTKGQKRIRARIPKMKAKVKVPEITR